MYYISGKKEDLQLLQVEKLLKQTFWAQDRSTDLIRHSITNSECFGAYLDDTKEQVAFARVVSDHVSMYYVCDVVVDRQYRGCGIGKALIHTIVTDERFQHLRGLLLTSHAHGLYEHFGFSSNADKCMLRIPDQPYPTKENGNPIESLRTDINDLS